jgi:hypothetical protein
MITCKKCFTCKRNYHLFLFHVDSSKYQRESAKGKCIECRICCYKRMKKDKGIMQRIDGKFTFVNINPIKYMLKK